MEDDCFCQSKTFKYACNVRRGKFIEKRLYRLSLQQTYVSCIIFSLDKKLLCICLNDSVEQRERKLSVTIWRLCNCTELLRFTSRRTTLCKYSGFLGNSKIDDCVYRKCGQNLPSALFNHRHRSCSFSSSRCIRRSRLSRIFFEGIGGCRPCVARCPLHQFDNYSRLTLFARKELRRTRSAVMFHSASIYPMTICKNRIGAQLSGVSSFEIYSHKTCRRIRT